MSAIKSYTYVFMTLTYITSTLALPTKFLSPLPTEPTEEPVRTEYTEGEDIRLDCSANGTLNPLFHWLHNGKYIEQSPLDINARNLISSPIHHQKYIAKANLVIKNAKPEDSGKYTCIADSLTKRVVRSFTITVSASTTKQPIVASSESSQLRIYQHTDEIFQEENKPAYVVCRATQGATNPSPTIRWTLGEDGDPIEESDNVKIHSNGDLEISRLTVDYHSMFYGDLFCHAISEDGHSTVKTQTFVYVV